MTEIKGTSGLLSSVNLHVDDTGGPGRPVVLIHGWPLSAESWSEQVAPLSAAGYRVVSYDRRGFGRSDKPGKGYDYDTLAEDLSEVLEELDLSDVTLVGFSMGGGEVARYVSKHGEGRLRSVVFAAAVTPYLMNGEGNPDGPLDRVRGRARGRAPCRPRVVLRRLHDRLLLHRWRPQGHREPAAGGDPAVRTSPTGSRARCMEAWGTTDFREDLAKVTVPTLVIHGDGDATVPFEGSALGPTSPSAEPAGRRPGRPARSQRQPRRRVQHRTAGVPAALTGSDLELAHDRVDHRDQVAAGPLGDPPLALVRRADAGDVEDRGELALAPQPRGHRAPTGRRGRRGRRGAAARCCRRR